MKLVGAGLGRDVDHAAGGPPVLRGERASGGLEFLDRLYADGVDQRASADPLAREATYSRVGLGPGRLVDRGGAGFAETHIHAVHEQVVPESRRAVELDSATLAVVRIRISINTGLQTDELLKITAVQGKRLDLGLIDYDAQVRRGGIDQRRRVHNLNRFGSLAHHHLKIEARPGSRVQGKLRSLGPLKTCVFRLQNVAPGRQHGKLEVARIVRDGS